MILETIRKNDRIRGIVPNEIVQIVSCSPLSSGAAGRYEGLVIAGNPHITQDGLVVKLATAKAQIEKEKTTVVTTVEPTTGTPSSMPTTPTAGKGIQPNPLSSYQQKRTHFLGSVTCDLSRFGTMAGQINTEILQHLNGLSGVDVRVTLDIQVTAPSGVPAYVERIVKENCNTLKFSAGEFEW
ncbi:MAG: hypothetical protein Ta2B_13170 [Termitinemataceae bacterium]|nr:MAG: hypothetical protein Ta2B_13170 [Termitinemataceae bacterium]